MTTAQHTVTVDQLRAYLSDVGIDMRYLDLRHCVHEACHGLLMHVEGPWTNARIAWASDRLPPGEALVDEMIARAAEGIAMHRLGIEWDLEVWAGISAMEWVQGGRGDVPFDAWYKGIRRMQQPGSKADKLVDKLFALALQEVAHHGN